MQKLFRKTSSLFKSFFDSEKVAGLLLVNCTIVSLALANGANGENYIHFFHEEIDLSFANISLNYQWSNG